MSTLLNDLLEDQNTLIHHEHYNRVCSNFIEEKQLLLTELIVDNPNYPDNNRDFDTLLLERYEKTKGMLNELSTLDKPSVGHLVKVLCKNGNKYEKALITSVVNKEVTICVMGGAFIHSFELSSKGLRASYTGGYFFKAHLDLFKPCDYNSKNYTFSNTDGVKAGCGVSISFKMKRWIFDDTKGNFGFY